MIWPMNYPLILSEQLAIHDFDDKLANISPSALAKQDSRFREVLKTITHR
jgi:hypothetical protein